MTSQRRETQADEKRLEAGRQVWIELLSVALWYLFLTWLTLYDGQAISGDTATLAVVGTALFVFVYSIRKILSLKSSRNQRQKDIDRPGGIPIQQLINECNAMILFAGNQQREVDRDDIRLVASASRRIESLESGPDSAVEFEQISDDLIGAHQRLALLLEPARPSTIRLVSGDPPAAFPWLGSIRLVRMLVGLVVALAPLFVLLGLQFGDEADDVYVDVVDANVVDAEDGESDSEDGKPVSQIRCPQPEEPDQADCGVASDSLRTFGVAMYLIVAAAAGAIFAALTKAKGYIDNLSYDERYESSYWVRVALGVVSGLILTTILNRVLFGAGETTSTARFNITLPLLAVVGGFSSDLVYRILQKVLDAIQSLFSASPSELEQTAKADAETRLRDEFAQTRAREMEAWAALQAVAAQESEQFGRIVSDFARARIDTAVDFRSPIDITPNMTEIRTMLAAAGLGVVDVDFGSRRTIELRGAVRSKAERDHAGHLVRTIAGSYQVDNRLTFPT